MMAKIELGKPLELVAVEEGFRDGALVHKGSTFVFTPTKLDKKTNEPRLPKWAALPGDQRLKPKPERSGDIRPAAAKTASRAKLDGMAIIE
jgi:hypothetical protein